MLFEITRLRNLATNGLWSDLRFMTMPRTYWRGSMILRGGGQINKVRKKTLRSNFWREWPSVANTSQKDSSFTQTSNPFPYCHLPPGVPIKKRIFEIPEIMWKKKSQNAIHLTPGSFEGYSSECVPSTLCRFSLTERVLCQTTYSCLPQPRVRDDNVGISRNAMKRSAFIPRMSKFQLVLYSIPRISNTNKKSM
jgi:hypothetical protein